MDTPLTLVHAIEGQVVTAPAADLDLVCGRTKVEPGASKWLPCRTVAAGTGGMGCQLYEEPLAKPVPCAGLQLVKVGAEATNVIAEAFAQAH